jgi:hypothetical protein
MLYLDSALELHGVTLFRDYGDPGRYYYLPRHPRLTREGGQPLFQLLVYREDVADDPRFRASGREGGGFLTMTVDVGVPEATLEAIRRELSGRAGREVDLVAAPLERGAVRVSALGTAVGGARALEGAAEDEEGGAPEGPRFVERILGGASPSLYGDNRATFSLELDARGAQVMKASLGAGGASQVSVIYELDYRGLLPAYHARIEIDFRQSYQYLRTRAQLNTLWLRADVDAEMERLEREGHIRIAEVDFRGMTPEASAQARERLVALARELAQWTFFKPGLKPGEVLAVDRGQLAVHDPTSAALSHTAGFTTPLVQAIAGAGRDQPQAPIPGRTDARGGLGGQDPVEGAANASPTGGPPAPSGGETPAATGPTAVERWNQAGRPQGAFLLRDLRQEERQMLTFDLRQISAVQRTAGPQGNIRLLSGDTSLAGRVLEIDLDSTFFERLEGTVTSGADLDAAGVESMLVKLQYGLRENGTYPKDTFEHTIHGPGEAKEYVFAMDRRLSLAMEYQVELRHKPGFALGDRSPTSVTPWLSTTGRSLDVDPRAFSPVFTARVEAGEIEWTAVRSVQCTLTYVHEGQAQSRTFVLRDGATTGAVPIRPASPDLTAWTLEATWFYVTGDQDTTRHEGDASEPLVLNQPPSRAVVVRIDALDPLDRYQRIAVEVSHASATGERTASFDLSGPGANASWTISRDDDEPPSFRYRVTSFGRDGSVRTEDWVTTSDRRVIVGDSFERFLVVEAVLLASDFAADGLLGARLRIAFPDAPPGVDADAEKFWRAPSAEPFRWKVPIRAGGAPRYSYTIEWIQRDGARRVVGPVSSEDETILLHPALVQ